MTEEKKILNQTQNHRIHSLTQSRIQINQKKILLNQKASQLKISRIQIKPKKFLLNQKASQLKKSRIMKLKIIQIIIFPIVFNVMDLLIYLQLTLIVTVENVPLEVIPKNHVILSVTNQCNVSVNARRPVINLLANAKNNSLPVFVKKINKSISLMTVEEAVLSRENKTIAVIVA
jgi:hypothetical protein